MKPENVRYNCAVDAAMAVIEGRWKCTILCMLSLNGPLRFSELQRMIGEITSRILSRQLKELEADGMLVRSVDSHGRLKVEYSLSDKGRSIIPVLESLGRWGVEHQCLQVIVPRDEDVSQAANLDRNASDSRSVKIA